MSRNARLIAASPQTVWQVLADGWLYPLWVVGASRIREVEPDWPAPGARIHHSVGAWPLLIDDHTVVVESTPPARLHLLARAWPAGEADVDIELVAVGADTQVTMTEQAVSGPGTLVPKPMLDPILTWRNTESLRRLAYVAERRENG